MDKIIKRIKKPIILAMGFLLYLLVLSLLNYLGALSLSFTVKLNFVFMAILMFIFGLTIGKKASKKGYLEGLKLGGIAVLILFVLNIIFYRNFDLQLFLYYLVLLASSTIGSMIGINLHR